MCSNIFNIHIYCHLIHSMSRVKQIVIIGDVPKSSQKRLPSGNQTWQWKINYICITVIFLASAPTFFRVDFKLHMFDFQRVVKIFGHSTFNLILHPYLLIIHIYYQSYSTSIFIPCSGWPSGDPETFRARTHGRGCAEYNCQHGQVGCQNGRPGRVFGCPNMAG